MSRKIVLVVAALAALTAAAPASAGETYEWATPEEKALFKRQAEERLEEERATIRRQAEERAAADREIEEARRQDAEARAAREARDRAAIPDDVFRIAGRIVDRDANGVLVWGFAIPENGNAAALGAHFTEANIAVNFGAVTNPIFYRDVACYVGRGTGTNAFGARVPVSIYGPCRRAGRDAEHQSP